MPRRSSIALAAWFVTVAVITRWRHARSSACARPWRWHLAAGTCFRARPGPSVPSGGTHLYFRAPAAAIANSASRLGPLIDVRAQGGYVLGPGSRVGGCFYARVNAAIPALLPAWIARALSQPPLRAMSSPLAMAGTAQAVPYGLAALREESARVAAASEGTRNDTLNRAAFSLGQLVAAGCLPGSAVIDSLADAARESGLPEREANRTINSGMTAGARRPRAPLPRLVRQPPTPGRPQLPATVPDRRTPGPARPSPAPQPAPTIGGHDEPSRQQRLPQPGHHRSPAK
jgi:hypothetical protein